MNKEIIHKITNFRYSCLVLYLKQGVRSKQELDNYSVRNTHICVTYLFRPDKLVREQCVWNVGWKYEEEGKQDTFKWLL